MTAEKLDYQHHYQPEPEDPDRSLVREVNERHGLTDGKLVVDIDHPTRLNDYCCDLVNEFHLNHSAESATEDDRTAAAERTAAAVLEPLMARWEQHQVYQVNFNPLAEKVETALSEALLNQDPQELSRVLDAAAMWGGSTASEPNAFERSGFNGNNLTAFDNISAAAYFKTHNPRQHDPEIIAAGYNLMSRAAAVYADPTYGNSAASALDYTEDRYGADSVQHCQAQADAVLQESFAHHFADLLQTYGQTDRNANSGQYYQEWSEYRTKALDPARDLGAILHITRPDPDLDHGYDRYGLDHPNPARGVNAAADFIYDHSADEIANLYDPHLQAIAANLTAIVTEHLNCQDETAFAAVAIADANILAYALQRLHRADHYRQADRQPEPAAYTPAQLMTTAEIEYNRANPDTARYRQSQLQRTNPNGVDFDPPAITAQERRLAAAQAAAGRPQ